jgi:hypothetical protein
MSNPRRQSWGAMKPKVKIGQEITELMQLADSLTDGLDRDESLQAALELEQLANIIKLKVSDWRESANLLPYQQPKLFREFWWN